MTTPAPSTALATIQPGAGRIVRKTARRAGIAKTVTPTRSGMPSSPLTTSLDAGVPLRDVQEAASHADPRTTDAV